MFKKDKRPVFALFLWQKKRSWALGQKKEYKGAALMEEFRFPSVLHNPPTLPMTTLPLTDRLLFVQWCFLSFFVHIDTRFPSFPLLLFVYIYSPIGNYRKQRVFIVL
jgi:hypothetical protein